MRLLLSSIALLALLPACQERVPRNEDPSTCANGSDDDRDGRFDCADDDCYGVGVCGGGSDAGPTDAGLRDTPRLDVLPEVCAAPIDLTFVLDVSTSMTEEAGALRDGIGDIYAAAQALTTDTRFSLVVFVDDALVVNGCAPFASVAELTAEFDRWRTFCSTNNSPVSGVANADCAENSLDAIYAAATTCTWRADATHILVHVTDDTFEEPPYQYSGDVFSSGVPAVHFYGEVLDALVSREIRVGAFAMEVPEDCGAGTSGDTGRGFFTSYRSMMTLPMATGGRVWDIADVREGDLNMSTAIAEMVDDEYCTVF
jgi:hypothetical protein